MELCIVDDRVQTFRQQLQMGMREATATGPFFFESRLNFQSAKGIAIGIEQNKRCWHLLSQLLLISSSSSLLLICWQSFPAFLFPLADSDQNCRLANEEKLGTMQSRARETRTRMAKLEPSPTIGLESTLGVVLFRATARSMSSRSTNPPLPTFPSIDRPLDSDRDPTPSFNLGCQMLPYLVRWK